MPRKASMRQGEASECVVHGERCALASGGPYRSDLCRPVYVPPPLLRQEVEMREIFEHIRRSKIAESEGVTVDEVAERERAAKEAERQAERQRRAGLSLRALDVEARAHAKAAAARPDPLVELANLLEQARQEQARRESQLIAADEW